MTTARRVFRRELDTGWIEVWDRGQRRSLWFDDAILQAIRLTQGVCHLPVKLDSSESLLLTIYRKQRFRSKGYNVEVERECILPLLGFGRGFSLFPLGRDYGSLLLVGKDRLRLLHLRVLRL